MVAARPGGSHRLNNNDLRATRLQEHKYRTTHIQVIPTKCKIKLGVIDETRDLLHGATQRCCTSFQKIIASNATVTDRLGCQA